MKAAGPHMVVAGDADISLDALDHLPGKADEHSNQAEDSVATGVPGSARPTVDRWMRAVVANSLYCQKSQNAAKQGVAGCFQRARAA